MTVRIPRARCLFYALFCFLLGGFLSPLQAQQPDKVFEERGLNENRSYFSLLPFERVDTASGSLVLTFTDLVLPGNAGAELRLQRTFNSKAAYPGRTWTFGIAGMVMEIYDVGPPPEELWENPPGARPFPDPIDAEFRPTLYRADGGAVPTIWAERPTIGFPETYRHVVAGDFTRYDTVTRELRMPDGTLCKFSAPDQNKFSKLEEIHDRFGNVVYVDWDANGHLAGITQHLSATQVRTITFTPSDTVTFPASMTYEGRTWTYVYNNGLITEALPPVGPGWTYAYGSTIGVTTPHGGHVEYQLETHTFPDYSNPSSPIPSGTYSHVVARRTTGGQLPAGTWFYHYDSDSLITTITGPNDVVTTVGHDLRINSIMSGLGGGIVPNLRTVTQGAVILEHETTEYTGLAVVPDMLGEGMPAVTKRRIKRGAASDGTKTTYETIYEYRGFNDHRYDYHRPTTIRESGDLSRVTTRSYKYDIHPDILGSLETETVTGLGESATKSWEFEPGTGFVTKETILGVATSFGPGARGNIGSVTDANGHTTTYEWSWGVPSARITPMYRVQRGVRSDGAITSVTEAGRTTSYGYDDLQRQTGVTPPMGLATVTTYDPAGRWIKSTRGNTWTQNDLDGAGRTRATTDAVGSKTETTYDTDGRVVAQSLPWDSTHPKQLTTRTYDGIGRLTEKKHPDNERVTYNYDGLNVTIEDEEGRTSTHYYQAFGNPNEARLVAVKDAKNQQWEYSYNLLGKITKVVAPDNNVNTQRSWKYNTKGRLEEERHPESGKTSYEYDAAGNLEFKTLHEAGPGSTNIRLKYEYDDNDRLKRVEGPNGQWTSFTYEHVGGATAGSDRRKILSRGGVIVSEFKYDNAGRLSERKDSIDGSDFTTVQDYDDLDNIDEVTYPDQRLVKYGYDNANRITSIQDLSNQSSPTTYASSFTYHPSGAIESYHSGNGVLNTMTPDPERLWPSAISVTLPTPGQQGLAISYQYDKTGNVRFITEPARPDQNHELEYDSLDRLRWVKRGGSETTYTYDVHGTQQLPGRVYDYDTLRLTSDIGGVTFEYDAAGRMTRRLNETFSYNMTGMMTRAALHGRTVDYDYDADDLRKLRKELVGGQLERSFFIHGLGSQLLSEITRSGNAGEYHPRDYIYAGSRLIAVAAPSRGTVSWTVATRQVEEPANPPGACNAVVAPRIVDAVIALRLPGAALTQPVTVSYVAEGGSYIDGLATSGSDFSVTGTVVFPAGSQNGAQKTVQIQIVHDCKDEADETFQLRLTGVSDPTNRVKAIGTAVQTVTILDNDEPPVINISQDVTLTEPATTANVDLDVTLSAPSGRVVKVNTFATPEVSGCPFYGHTAATLTFFEDETLKKTTVTIPGNARGNEPAKRLFVDLDTPVNATLGRARATVTVNDQPSDAITLPAWPGNFLAHARGAERMDYVTLVNPFGRSVSARVTLVFDNGSALQNTYTIAPFARHKVDLHGAETACEVGASVAVQVENGDLPGVEHAGYIGANGGVSSESVKAAPTWYFAEGHTTWGREQIDLFNPNDFPVRVALSLHGPGGVLRTDNHDLPKLSRKRVALNGLWPVPIEHGAIARATIPNTTTPANIAATRVVLADPQFVWNTSTDGHATAGTSQPSSTLYLAEGHEGGALRTYLLLLNPSTTATVARVTYLHETLGPYPVDVQVPAGARVTHLPPGELVALGGGFGYKITTDNNVPLVAERAMYTLGNSAGHAGVASATASGIRAFAEGATVDYETWFLVANPSETEEALVVFEFYDHAGNPILPNGELSVPAGARRGLNVGQLPHMRNAIFHTFVSSSVPVVTERVSYWPTHVPAALVGLALPFAPGATFLSVPKVWNRPTVVPPSTYPVTPAPYTLVGPKWSPAALASAAALPRPESLNVKTIMSAGNDAWLGAHLSGGWEVSATPRLGVINFTTTSSQLNEGGTVTLTVRMTTADQAPLSRAVTANIAAAAGPGPYQATAGTDFSPSSWSVTFPAGTASGATRTIVINVPNDARYEYPETFRIQVANVVGGAAKGTQWTHDVTIENTTAAPTLSVNDVAVNENAGQATFTVHVSALAETWVSVTAKTTPVTARAGDDYTYSEAHVTFPPNTATATFTVPIINDSDIEPLELFYVDLTDPQHSTIADARAVGQILDDETGRAVIDLAWPTLLIPDATTAPGFIDLIQVYNPHEIAVTARVTYTRPNGSGVVHDHPIAARARLTINPFYQTGVGGQGEVSIAVQSITPGRRVVVDHSQYWGANTESGTSTRAVAPAPTWYFAEGAVNDYFEEHLTVYNPTGDPIVVTVTIYPEGGAASQTFSFDIDQAPGRRKINLSQYVTNLTHGTVVTARRRNDNQPSPIAVERASFWAYGDRREGSRSTGSPVTSTTWGFAEGAKGTYNTYLTLLNPTTTSAPVGVYWAYANSVFFSQGVNVPPQSRLTVHPPEWLPVDAFAINIESPNVGIVAERSIYYGANWNVGASDVGAPDRKLKWRFAEGETGGFFDAYLTFMNPFGTPANVTITFRKTNGTTVTHTITVPNSSRYTVAIDQIPGMETATFTTDVDVTNGIAIVAERTMYFPGWGWEGSHVSLGTPW